MSEKLVQYLDGELAGAEKEILQQQLSSDKNLQEELESLQSTREAVKMYGLQQKVAGIHSQMMQEMRSPVKKISSSRRILRYGIAVAASVILIVGGIIGYNFYNLSSNKVFAGNYHPYELNTMRDGDTARLSPVEKAYREKDYKKAVDIHEMYDPNPPKETFLIGMSFIELGKNAEAIEELKKVIARNEANKTSIFKEEAEYYLALTYIRNRDYDYALDLLRKIQEDPGHLYHEKVNRKLIRQVKMLKWR